MELSENSKTNAKFLVVAGSCHNDRGQAWPAQAFGKEPKRHRTVAGSSRVNHRGHFARFNSDIIVFAHGSNM